MARCNCTSKRLAMHAHSAFRGTRGGKRFGTVAAEFAVVGVIFFVFLFGIIEYGRLVMVRQVLENAAREGSRYAVVHTADKTTADVQNVVTNYLAGQGAQMQGLNIQVYMADPATGANLGAWTDAGAGQAIAVQVNGNYRTILPALLLMPSTIPLQVRSVMYSEAN